MAIATQAESAQPALGAAMLNSRLQFWSIKSGHYLIDIFAGHVFEIRLTALAKGVVWMAEVRRQNTIVKVARRACRSRQQAVAFCERFAARLGGAS